MQVQRCAKKGEVKRTANSIQSGDDEALHGQSCSSYGSDNDSNASQEMNGGGSTSSCFKGSSVLNLSGKTRANRGSATDPQSLYARVLVFISITMKLDLLALQLSCSQAVII